MDWDWFKFYTNIPVPPLFFKIWLLVLPTDVRKPSICSSNCCRIKQVDLLQESTSIMDTLGSNSAQFPQLVHELSHHNNTTINFTQHSPFLANHPSDHQEFPYTLGRNKLTSPGQMDEGVLSTHLIRILATSLSLSKWEV